MLVLLFLGRSVEVVYGGKEFLRLYLVMVVFASVVWAAANKIIGTPGFMREMYGASGAIAGVVVLICPELPPPHAACCSSSFPYRPGCWACCMVGLRHVRGKRPERAGRTWPTRCTWPAPRSHWSTTSGVGT